MSFPFIPLHDKVAVLPIEEETKTSGGIIIPDSAKEKPMRGKIMAIGEGSRKDNGEIIPMQVKVGDVVLYGKWGGTEVKIGSDTIMVMKESDILGKIKN